MTARVAAGDWWATCFRGAARRIWRRSHSPEENRAQARAIAERLGLGADDVVLDVPCGEGRLALELAALGYHVHGVDRCSASLDEARQAARRAQLELELTSVDMRALPWSARFAAAFCAGNSFGLFDEAGDRAFLAGVARALRPRGRFLLEYPLAAELVGAQRLGRDWRQVGDHLVLSEARLDERSGRLEALYTFLDLSRPEEREEHRTSQRVYGGRELEALAASAGLRLLARHGGLDGRSFGWASEELWLLFERA